MMSCGLRRWTLTRRSLPLRSIILQNVGPRVSRQLGNSESLGERGLRTSSQLILPISFSIGINIVRSIPSFFLHRSASTLRKLPVRSRILPSVLPAASRHIRRSELHGGRGQACQLISPISRSFAGSSGAEWSFLGSLGTFAGAIAKIYVGVLVLIYVMQRRLLFLPPSYVADPTSTGGELLVISGKGKDEKQLTALLFPPPSHIAPVVVYFHGNADQIGWSAAHLGQRILKEYGVGFAGIEYPGYGLASGTPSEASIYSATEQLLEHLRRDRKLDASRVVLLGHSVGGGVAVEMARRGLAHKLILVSPFMSIAQMAAEIYPFVAPVLNLAPFLVKDKFDNVSKSASVHVPTLIIHGRVDEIVPCQQGEALSKRIPGARFFGMEGLGHNDILDHPAVLHEIVAFARLKKAD